MITNKMWKALETFFLLVPPGLVNFSSSVLPQLKKSNQYLVWAIRYFLIFVPNAAALPIYTLLKLLTINLPLHMFAIHIAMLVITLCVSLFSYVFLYTVFGNHDGFFLHFNRVSIFQVKSSLFGKSCDLDLI